MSCVWTLALASTCRVRRSEQRREAVWVLYQGDLLDRPVGQEFPPNTHPFTRALAESGRRTNDSDDRSSCVGPIRPRKLACIAGRPVEPSFTLCDSVPLWPNPFVSFVRFVPS